jgi:hypothetical protein
MQIADDNNVYQLGFQPLYLDVALLCNQLPFLKKMGNIRFSPLKEEAEWTFKMFLGRLGNYFWIIA